MKFKQINQIVSEFEDMHEGELRWKTQLEKMFLELGERRTGIVQSSRRLYRFEIWGITGSKNTKVYT